MRLVCAVALVVTLGGSEIERAQQVARGRDAEREQFHRRYLFDVKDDTVTQIEVITEFRRLVLTTEDHLRLGDQLFSRGLRAAEAAMAPTRGLLTFKSKLRFHPQNNYVEIPDFRFALGPAASSTMPAATSALEVLDTDVSGEFSEPFKSRGGKKVKAILGATLRADVPASNIGQVTRPLGVVLDGKEIVRTAVDFARLD